MDFTKDKILPLLKDIEIFSSFDESILNQFAENMKEQFLPKDTVLFNKGDKESAMYIILGGSVRIHDGDYVFTILKSKQFFGEYSLIDSSVRSATVTATTDTQLLELKQETFNKVTLKRPDIWKSMLITLTKRLREYNVLEEKLTLRTVDISKKKYEIEREKENIVEQKKELEAINKTKDKFFTIIAHDLKNPFSTVINLADELVEFSEAEDQSKIIPHAKQISRFSKNAFSLLENLLQWSRSQSGNLKINFKKTNIKQIIDNVIELFYGVIDQKSISIESNVNETLFGYVDKDMLTAVIRNLLSNAIKHSYQNGKITILVNDKDDMLEFTIKDFGTGMDKEFLDTLFRLDIRSNHEDDNEDGSGLGLILCKEFVFKNGGEIWANSEKGQGTTITFTLPKAL